MKRHWALLLLLASCATSQSTQTVKDLKTSVNGYLEAFRWKNYAMAAQYLPASDRTAFLTTFEEDGDAVHVEDVQVLRVDIESEDAAEITVRYRFMQLPSVTVERKVVTQSWHRSDGRWLMEYEEPRLVELDRSLQKKREPAQPAGGEEGETQVDVEGPWSR